MLRVMTMACALVSAAMIGKQGGEPTDPPPCPAVSGGPAKMLEFYQFADTSSHYVMKSWRQGVGLPAVPVSQIVAVSDTTVCRRALTAYNTHLTRDSLAASVAVNVIKYGSTRFIIADPTHVVGEWTHELVADTAFNRIAVAGR